jgi:hypothetical protein
MPIDSTPASSSFSWPGARVVLAHTPAVLSAWLGPLPAALLDVDEGPGTWSPRAILRHVVWCDVDDWVPRARLIKTAGTTQAFTPFDREGGNARYGDWPVDRLLDEFGRLRAENLAAIGALLEAPEDLARQGRHPELGVVTMAQLLATWVTHDLGHLTQIGRVLHKHAGRDAGPWRAYFSALRDTP